MRTAVAIAVTVSAVLSCTRRDQPRSATFADVPVVPFDSLFLLVHSVRLRPPVESPIASPIAMAVTSGLAIVADPGQATVGVFGRADGEFRRRFGRAGDGPGEYRIPGALQVDDRGYIWVLDAGRQAVSVRDTAGGLIAERVVPGSWSGLAVTNGHVAVLSGRRAGVIDSASVGPDSPVLHQLDSAGVVRRSYLRVSRPTDEFKSTFNNFFVASIGDVLAVGSYDTNAVRFRGRTSGREWTASIGAPWYRSIRWPEDGKPPAGPSVIDAINAWVRQQVMLSLLVPLDRGRLLAVFRSTSAAGELQYSYVVADTSGHSRLASTASPSQVLQVVGDTAFALAVDSDGNVALETRAVRIPPASH